MYSLVTEGFKAGSKEGGALLSTGKRELILTAGGPFWSNERNEKKKAAGKNFYGRLLMKWRKELQKGTKETEDNQDDLKN